MILIRLKPKEMKTFNLGSYKQITYSSATMMAVFVQDGDLIDWNPSSNAPAVMGIYYITNCRPAELKFPSHTRDG